MGNWDETPRLISEKPPVCHNSDTMHVSSILKKKFRCLTFHAHTLIWISPRFRFKKALNFVTKYVYRCETTQ